ncbi:MAG: patatin-like phospholipase family protein [Firmicutes bacterium]|nr:patatin-like phospholipase family protein [Bacillota bacterium]
MIGLSLAGGGARGSYQIGAYMALKKCNIKIDGFVGTSIGSFNAAMLAAGFDKELLELWEEANMTQIMALDEELASLIRKKNKNTQELKLMFSKFRSIIANRGLETSGMKEILNRFDIEGAIRKNKKDYGLCTIKMKKIEVVYRYIEDIPEGKLNDYILGSCRLPVFKKEILEDDSYFLDGGFYDNSPVNLLLDKGYDKVYVVDLAKVMIKRKIKDKNKIVMIKPSRNLGSRLTLNKDLVRSNILLGYYDTLKIVKNLDGYKYIFKVKSENYYEKLIKGVNKKILNEVEKQFKTTEAKKLVIKALEYVMKKENYEYTAIYKPYKVIKKIQKNLDDKNGVYKFINELKK